MANQQDQLIKKEGRRTQRQELAAARQEKRGPRCVRCGEDLSLVAPAEHVWAFRWDGGSFVLAEAEALLRFDDERDFLRTFRCAECDAESESFVDFLDV